MKDQNNSWNKIASTYSTGQGETGDPLHQFMIDPTISEMLGNIAGQTILDAGCGNGYWVRRLAQHAKKVIGIDSSSALIKDAKSVQSPPNTEYHVANLLKGVDLSDLYFDTILSSMVFQYLHSIENTVAEFKRMLKPNGQIVIAIQHPIYQYHFRVQAKAGCNSSSFSDPAGYFDRRTVEQAIMSGKSTIKIYNRPLSDYVRPFLRQGFVLADFAEPEYSDKLLSEAPRYKKIAEIPRVAIFAFQKY